jgi:hypothetical protein
MIKVFFGGSRRLGRLNEQVKARAEKMMSEGLQVLVGDANGADKAIQKFFADRQYSRVRVFFSGETPRNNLGSWQIQTVKVDRTKRDFKFHTVKDLAMCEAADYGFMVWDGESQGTVNNILNLLERGKKVVIYHSPDQEFLTFRAPADAEELLRRIAPDRAVELDKKVGLRRRIAASQGEIRLV